MCLGLSVTNPPLWAVGTRMPFRQISSVGEHGASCGQRVSLVIKSHLSDMNERAYDMAEKISDMLDGERDPHVVESTMAFVAAIMCINDMDLCGVPAAELARRHTVNILKHVRALEPRLSSRKVIVH